MDPCVMQVKLGALFRLNAATPEETAELKAIIQKPDLDVNADDVVVVSRIFERQRAAGVP